MYFCISFPRGNPGTESSFYWCSSFYELSLYCYHTIMAAALILSFGFIKGSWAHLIGGIKKQKTEILGFQGESGSLSVLGPQSNYILWEYWGSRGNEIGFVFWEMLLWAVNWIIFNFTWDTQENTEISVLMKWLLVCSINEMVAGLFSDCSSTKRLNHVGAQLLAGLHVLLLVLLFLLPLCLFSFTHFFFLFFIHFFTCLLSPLLSLIIQCLLSKALQWHACR